MEKNTIFIAAAFILSIIATLATFGQNILISFGGFVVVLLIAGGLFYAKKVSKREALLIFVLWFIFVICYYLYFSPGMQLASAQGTVLSDNWYQALNWIKGNTPECTVDATYWDPGHFITGIGGRAVVPECSNHCALWRVA